MPNSRSSLRTIASATAAPALQIARDSALLEIDPGATLRFYRWQPVGLTLGRFQAGDRFRVHDIPHELVRRPTGGGAIWHEHELTYCLSLPDDEALSSADWQVSVHEAIARALASLQFRAKVLEDGLAHGGPRAEGWCFAEPRRGDLIGPDGRKLCGSALRRTRRPRARLLMHGSLILEPPGAGPRCACLADQGRPPSIEDLESAIAREIGRTLDRTVAAGQLTEAEERRALALTAIVRVHGEST